MPRHHKITWVLLVVWFLGLAPSAFAEDSWVGKRIIPKRSGLRIGYTDKDGRERYVATLTQMTYTVEKDYKGWIRVRQRDVSGWFPKDDAVPLEDAVRYFSARIRRNARDVDAYARRAEAWKDKGEHEVALQDYHQVIRLQPEQKAWYINRGNVWLAKKDYDRAIADYSEVIRLDPNDFLAFYNRGLVRQAKGEHDRAIAD